jgi:hypothetical protein
MRPRNGKFTNSQWAKHMLARGCGLSEAEIERIRSNINSILRQRLVKVRTPADEFRELLEVKWQKDRGSP